MPALTSEGEMIEISPHYKLYVSDGVCPFLSCDAVTKHGHLVCRTCDAVRHGNIYCDECRRALLAGFYGLVIELADDRRDQ